MPIHPPTAFRRLLPAFQRDRRDLHQLGGRARRQSSCAQPRRQPQCLRLHCSRVRVRALSPRPTPLHDLVPELFDFFVHVDLPAQEGPTTRGLRQDGAGRGLTIFLLVTDSIDDVKIAGVQLQPYAWALPNGGGTGLGGRFLARGLDRFDLGDERWDCGLPSRAQAVVSHLEDGRFRILVDGHDHLAALHAGQMLDRA